MLLVRCEFLASAINNKITIAFDLIMAFKCKKSSRNRVTVKISSAPPNAQYQPPHIWRETHFTWLKWFSNVINNIFIRKLYAFKIPKLLNGCPILMGVAQCGSHFTCQFVVLMFTNHESDNHIKWMINGIIVSLWSG